MSFLKSHISNPRNDRLTVIRNSMEKCLFIVPEFERSQVGLYL
jgi:hypothetical protein